MTSAVSRRRYLHRYPLQGQVAVLCEGDLAGYESALLAELTAQHGYVDIWPCGTKSAIFGIADAIGRAVPIVAIEDRDFRTPDQAAAECKKKRQDRREKRGADIVAWRTWRRNEIENYLIEPAVLAPVFAQVFRVGEPDVLGRLESLLPSLVVDQAACWTIARFQEKLPDLHQYVPGLPRKTARPRWANEKRAVMPPEPSTVRKSLQDALNEKIKAFGKRRDCLNVDALITDFDKKCEEWSGPQLDSPTWRVDWSGKEILAWMRRWFAADPGWRCDSGAQHPRVSWEDLPKDEAEAQDREIEAALQPYLVRRFFERLEQQLTDDVAVEWSDLVSCIVSAMPSSGQH